MTAANLKPAERVYTPERDAIIWRDWPAGVHVAEILEAVAALPGPRPRSPRSIKERAYALGAKRPAGWAETRARAEHYAPWPADRIARAMVLYADADIAPGIIIASLNGEFPSLRPVTWKAIEQKMIQAGVRRPYKRLATAGRPPKRNIAMDQPMQAGVPASLSARIERAAKMLDGKGREFHVWSVVAHTGLEAWQVCCIAGRVAMGLPLR